MLCDELVAIFRDAADPDKESTGDFDFSEMQERQRETERVKFQRKELGDSAITRLNAILTEAQAERIKGR